MQLIVGRAEPVFPHFIMTRRLPTKQLLRLGDRAIHVLKYLEKAVHPRWPMTFEVAKHAVGVMVLLLTVVLLLTPVPLSNVAPAMVISLISLAYVEEDGFVLSAAFLAAIIVQNSSSLAPARLFFRHATRSTVNGRVGWTDGKKHRLDNLRSGICDLAFWILKRRPPVIN